LLYLVTGRVEQALNITTPLIAKSKNLFMDKI